MTEREPHRRVARRASRDPGPERRPSSPARSVRGAFVAGVVALVLAIGGVAAAQSVPQPGTRITYHSMSATIQGAAGALVADPDGNYVDPATGRRYGVQDISGSAAGEGFLQVDVTYVDDQVCAGLVTNFTLDRSNGMVLSSSQEGFVTDTGACYEAWVSPARLQGLPLGVTAQASTVRGQEVVGGQTLEVLRSSTNPSTGSASTAYDLGSGYLLSASSSSASTVATPGPGGAVSPATGRTLLTATRYMDVRWLPTPANLPPLPAHVQAMRALHYTCESGSYGTGMTLSEPCDQRVDVVARRAGLLRLRVTTRLGPSWVPFENDWIVSNLPVIGGIHVASDYLRSLTTGRTLDEDPVTGVRTVVLHVDANVAVVARQNAFEQVRSTYDLASGWLVESVTEQRLGDMVFFQRFALSNVE